MIYLRNQDIIPYHIHSISVIMIHLDMYLSMIERASKKRAYSLMLLGTHTLGLWLYVELHLLTVW